MWGRELLCLQDMACISTAAAPQSPIVTVRQLPSAPACAIVDAGMLASDTSFLSHPAAAQSALSLAMLTLRRRRRRTRLRSAGAHHRRGRIPAAAHASAMGGSKLRVSYLSVKKGRGPWRLGSRGYLSRVLVSNKQEHSQCTLQFALWHGHVLCNPVSMKIRSKTDGTSFNSQMTPVWHLHVCQIISNLHTPGRQSAESIIAFQVSIMAGQQAAIVLEDADLDIDNSPGQMWPDKEACYLPAWQPIELPKPDTSLR